MQYIDSLNTSTTGLNTSRFLQVNSKNNLSANSMINGTRKKLGSIIGIAKRSRSIHLSQCPSKNTINPLLFTS